MEENNQNNSAPSEKCRVLIAGWELDEDRHYLQRGEESIRLEPKTTQLLCYLARHAGETLSRERLLEEVWPGMIVSDEALSNAVNKIRKAFSDDSHNPQIIETIPKMGYRLIAPVVKEALEESPGYKEVVQNQSKSIQSGELFDKDQPSSRSRLYLWIGTAIILAIGVLAGLLLQTQQPDRQSTQTKAVTSKPVTSDLAKNKTNENQPEHSASKVTDSIPSILVFPFRNIGNNIEDEYFIDGMTEDIITDLSKLSNLIVIAGQTALTFKGRDISALDAGRELGTNYILDGSMRRAGSNLRINAQLTDVSSGTQLWSDRYDRKLENIFVIQDEITGHIVNALAIRLTSQEKEALKEITRIDFQAYDTFLKGQLDYKSRTPEGTSAAITAYRKAIRLDPTFARAYGAYAVALAFQYRMGWTEIAPNETLDRALEMAKKAVAIDNSIPQAHWALGYTHFRREEFQEAISAIEQALRLAPNYADGYGMLALINNNLGNADEAIKNIKKGMRINPYYTFEYPQNLGRSYYLSGNYQEAINHLLKALERNNLAETPRLYLIASYVKLGQLDDAEWELEQLLTQNPNKTLTKLSRTLPQKKVLMDALFEDLRAAGFPE